MLYHVEFARQLIILETNRRSAADSHVVGAGVAKIMVGEVMFRGVALCQCTTRCPGWQRTTLSKQLPEPVWHMRSRS